VLRDHPLVLFFSLAYLIGWIGFLPLVLSRTGAGLIPIDVPMEYIVAPTFTLRRPYTKTDISRQTESNCESKNVTSILRAVFPTFLGLQK
jgi:hypothetical protein